MLTAYLWAHPTPLHPCARCFLIVCQVANASVAELMATFCDNLLKKGLIYSGERGRIAFTVPHFGGYLRSQG